MMDRRGFLGTMTAAAILSRRMAWAQEHKIEKVGVQLYTVRDAMKADFDGTLAKVAAIGYKEVEFAGYFDHSPKDVRAAVARHGLTAPSTHIDYPSLSPDTFPKVVDDSIIIGHKYIVNPWIGDLRKEPDAWKKASETFNRAGEYSQKHGIQFAYHNHWFEFEPMPDGKLPYDVLLAECDPHLVKMEMDICWITVGRQDPLKYFAKYPGRFPLVHVKDVKTLPPFPAEGGQNFGDTVDLAPVGSGIIDWKKILAKSEQAGIKHYFVEHDKPADPFASIKTSYEYLKNLTF